MDGIPYLLATCFVCVPNGTWFGQWIHATPDSAGDLTTLMIHCQHQLGMKLVQEGGGVSAWSLTVETVVHPDQRPEKRKWTQWLAERVPLRPMQWQFDPLPPVQCAPEGGAF